MESSVHALSHPLVARDLTQLRAKSTDCEGFRAVIRRIARALAVHALADVATREDAAIAGARLEQLRIAVRRYALAHDGAIPSDQEALVPAQLAAPLVDPFDGQLLRLDPTAVWSVGEGLAPEGATLRLPL